jgi:hypothetical protein
MAAQSAFGAKMEFKQEASTLSADYVSLLIDGVLTVGTAILVNSLGGIGGFIDITIGGN